MGNLRMSDHHARHEQLTDLLCLSRTLSTEEIYWRVRNHPAWQKKNKESFPEKDVKAEIRRICRYAPRDFVYVEPDQWRRRSLTACSFCLTENVRVVQHEHRIYICLECAEGCVEVLRELKFMDDQTATNEAAILSFKEILGA